MKLHRLIPLFALALAALACSLAGNPAPTTDLGQIATNAVATLTALVPSLLAVTGTALTAPVATQANSTQFAATQGAATQPAASTQAPAVSATQPSNNTEASAPSTLAPAASGTAPATATTAPAGATSTAPAPPTSAASATPIAASCSLAYADNGTLFCAGSSGTPQTLATGQGLTGPLISPDGQIVAYEVVVSAGVAQLWVAGIAEGGAAPHLLVGQDKLPSADKSQINSPHHYEWLAGTHTLVFDTGYIPTGGPGGPGEYINADLWTANADTDAVASVLKAGSAGAFEVSPDGHTVAVSRGQGLDLVNADGSNYHQNVIKFPTIITYSEYTYKPHPQWSADGTYFSVAIPSADPMAADSSVSIYKISVDGTVAPKTKQPGNFVFGGRIAPQIAPNGQSVVFSRGDTSGGPDVLHMLTIQSGAAADNAFDTQAGPVGWGWSPDSQVYAYTVVPSGGAGKGYATGPGVEKPHAFADHLTAVNDLRWVNGNTVVFLGQISGGGWALYRQTTGADPSAVQSVVTGLTDSATMDVLP